MSSSKAERRGALGFVAEESLAFDPDDVLVREPGLLLDPRFLAALQVELEQEMGADEARVTLLQMGFLHGLRDAMLIVERSMEDPGAQTVSPAASPLPLRVRSRVGGVTRELEGCWPQRSEAAIHLARSGRSEGPVCALSAGYTSGWLSGILDTDLLAIETSCAARGDESCCFVAREVDAWAEADDAAVETALGALPYAAMRQIVERELAENAEPKASSPALASGEPVVQIWGPVMVIPFGGADEGLAAIDLIARDPGAANVSVVVVDLSGALIDEAFGAVALERMIESIESWGAEAILASPSQLSEPVLAGLERAPLMIQKDLPGAIAAAFRIAESQRQTL